MGKVLISFLGTGFPKASLNEPERRYSPFKYRIDGKLYKESSFMAAVLAEHYKVDRILMIGTVHSMWEEVYHWFQTRNGKKEDDGTSTIYFDIGQYCEQTTHKTNLEIPHQDKIEEALGEGSKVLLIKYGLNDEEIRGNITRILSLQEYLRNGDELIVDITHSFRSLPIFIMNLLIYLKNVSSKKITISHIHYGMGEARREFKENEDDKEGVAPVVDLKAMMEVQEWITGAYAFREFGNAYKISDLLKAEQQDRSAASTLFNFSEAINLNYLYSMQNDFSPLNGIRNWSYQSDFANLIIPPIIKSFVNTFNVRQDDCQFPTAKFQLQLADWQFKHKKYGQAYLTSNDALVSYVCEMSGIGCEYDEREAAKRILLSMEGRNDNEKQIVQRIRNGLNRTLTEDKQKYMRKWFKKHNQCRISIAHMSKVEFKFRWYRNGRERLDEDLHALFPNEIRNLQQQEGDYMELLPKHMIKLLDEDIKKLKEIIV